MQRLRARIQNHRQPHQSRQHAHRNQAAPVQVLRFSVHHLRRAGPSRSVPPHAREASQVSRVRLRKCRAEQAEAAHPMPHRFVALCFLEGFLTIFSQENVRINVRTAHTHRPTPSS